MKLHHLLTVPLLFFSIVARADNWTQRNTDDFDLKPEEMDSYKNKPTYHQPEEPEIKKPVEEVIVPQKPIEPVKPVKTYKNLKSTPVHLQDGSPVKFNKVVIFACENIPKKRFMFNKKQNDHCWIKNVKDAAQIAEKIGLDQFKKKSSVFEVCPESMDSEKSCNPKKIRNF